MNRKTEWQVQIYVETPEGWMPKLIRKPTKEKAKSLWRKLGKTLGSKPERVEIG